MYILRGCCAIAVFVAIVFAIPIVSSFGTGDARIYTHPSGFRPLLVTLFSLYLGHILVLAIEAASRGELPEIQALISGSIFAIISAAQLEGLTTLEKVQFFNFCIYLGCWALLFTVELFIIWLSSRPSSTPSPIRNSTSFLLWRSS